MGEPNQTITVVYLDDNVDRASVRDRLQSDPRIRLLEVRTREQLDKALADATVGAVLCELRPWGEADLEALDHVRAARADLPVLVVTSRGNESIAVAAMKHGAADYLTKTPDDLASLCKRLRSVVAQPPTQTAAQRDQLFKQSMYLLCMAGFDGYLKHWNPVWGSALGYTAEEMMSKPLAELIHPDDRATTAEMNQRLREGQGVQAVEARLRSKDGNYRWMLWNAVPCVEQQVYFATGQDITSRKLIEEQLRESQERFQLVAGVTKEAIWDWDLRDNRVWRNDRYLSMIGVPDDTLDGTIAWWRDRLHPDDRARVMASLPAPLVDGRQQWAMEYRLRCIDDRYAYVYDRGFVIFDNQGEPVRMVGSLMDITELKEAEEKLRNSEERFRLAVRATRDAVWDWEIDKATVWRSEGFQQLFGYRADEMTPDLDWWFSRIHPDDRERVFSSDPETNSSQREFEYRFRRADGSYADVYERGFVMYSPEGKAVRMVGTMMDISERRRAEELVHVHRTELAHISRVSTMGEIATGLAHELNQPLTAIANYAESCAQAIRSDSPDVGAKMAPWIEKIAVNTQRAAEMIRRLRGFTRKSEPRRSTIEINELIREVLGLLEAETRLQDVRLRWEATSQIFATVDRIQIQQVLVNLLRNAIEAMAGNPPDQRLVMIATALHSDRIQISVEDRGEGIEPDKIERVFEAFFTSKPSGVGIGLSISRSIVEDHGGRLWVAANPRRGVTFHFTLPMNGAHHESVPDSIRRG